MCVGKLQLYTMQYYIIAYRVNTEWIVYLDKWPCYNNIYILIAYPLCCDAQLIRPKQKLIYFNFNS